MSTHIALFSALIFLLWIHPTAHAATQPGTGAYRMTGTLTPAEVTQALNSYYGSIGVINTTPGGVPPSPPHLAGLTLSSGVLSPAFSTVVTSYTSTVVSVTNSITATPTLGGFIYSMVDGNGNPGPLNARVLVNGTPVSSNTASDPIPLAVGNTTITVELQQLSGTSSPSYQTTKTYSVVVNRPAVDTPEIGVRNAGGATDLTLNSTLDLGRVLAAGIQTFTTLDIVNTGYADLTNVSVVMIGRDAAEFSVVSPPASTVAGPTGKTSVSVRFTAGSVGRKSAVIRVLSNDADENPFDVNVTAIVGQQAELTAPSDGATLTPGTTTFSWDSGSSTINPGLYQLWFGSAPDRYDRGYGFFARTSHTTTVTSPGDGVPVYVTLWTLSGTSWLKSGGYVFTDYTAVPAELTSPANDATLASTSLPLAWTPGTGVTNYSIWAGSSPNSYDLHNAGLLTGVLARDIQVPADGQTVYVSLWSLINGEWRAKEYTFAAYAAPGTPVRARMIAPASGTTLPDATVTFDWDGGVGASQYSLWIGNSPRTYDVHNAGLLTTLSRTVTLPADARTLYVTLWTFINGSWQSNFYTYTAGTAPQSVKAKMLGPVPNGGTFGSSSVTFTWDAGVSADQYSLWVGNSPGTYDLHNSGMLTNTLSRTVTLPTDGRTVYVSLWTFMNGAWKANNYHYGTTTVSPGSGKATMLTPAPDSMLDGSSVTFAWNPAVGSSRYSMWVGNSPTSTSPDAYSLYNAGLITNQTTATATLPTDGRTLHVTLWTDLNGSWQANHYTYTAFTAAGGAAKAKMLTPADGTLLPGATVTFTWDAGQGATQYSLWIGGGINNATSTNPEAYNLHNAGLLTNTFSRTVTTLPTDGSPVYVTLWTFINGKWQSNMYDYQAFIAP